MKIRANDLVKEYGGRIVVDHVSLEVAQGSIVGLLGKNGAGKTTTFYMIVGLEHPDRGTVHLDELEVIFAAGSVHLSKIDGGRKSPCHP